MPQTIRTGQSIRSGVERPALAQRVLDQRPRAAAQPATPRIRWASSSAGMCS